MRDLDKNEAINTYGGISAWAAIGLGAAVVFLIGVVDGFIRPLKCN